MGHVTKFSAGAMRGMSNHCERKTEKHKNKSIDPTKSYLNYALDNNDNPMNYFEQRMSEIRINKQREDIKVAASWVITQPRDINQDESRLFFETTHNFLAKRYGEKNVVWSRVHMDETTPHLHFCFMPVTPDKKHEGQEKLCAKDVLNRKDLNSFHTDLSKEMFRVFGRDIGIETGQTEKNLPLEKFKVKQKLDKTVNSIEEEINEKRKVLDDINKQIQPTINAREIIDALKNDAKKVTLSLYHKIAVHEYAYDAAIEYLSNISGKEQKIAELCSELNDMKLAAGKTEDMLKTRTKELYDVRVELRKENESRRAAEKDNSEHLKILKIIDQIKPGIVRDASTKARLMNRKPERGMER